MSPVCTPRHAAPRAFPASCEIPSCAWKPSPLLLRVLRLALPLRLSVLLPRSTLLNFPAAQILDALPALTCEPQSSSLPPRPSAGPFACAHWCACAVREPANSGGDEFPDTPEFQSGAARSSAFLCAD